MLGETYRLHLKRWFGYGNQSPKTSIFGTLEVGERFISSSSMYVCFTTIVKTSRIG